MASTYVPLGFRFHPTDEELVLYYLKRKILGKKFVMEVIAEVNVYRFSPWDLPDQSCLKTKDRQWFFFCRREKFPGGSRVKRSTEKGYWKASGNDQPVLHNGKKVGTRKTLVFHVGHASRGERTDWVAHEYHILDEELAATGLQDTYVVWKIFLKDGPGPKHGAQYGAPFNEADWEMDDQSGDLTVAAATPLLNEDQMSRPTLPGQLTIEDFTELLTPLSDDDLLILNEYGGAAQMNDNSVVIEPDEALQPFEQP
ncbi:NAC domain containing protein 82 [Striga hermonthica]|uniref:NAC domain containing protein 82 n=1 Tax=Striga hermonthica TaxID=68872 RepID=A0A9N7NLP4_STRHE|nr:NAC domain containing protein 82 [Striga hermonthica]